MTSPTILCPNEVKAQIPDLLWDLNEERVAIFVGEADNGTVTIRDIWPAKNRHQDKRHHFALKKRQWDKFFRQAEQAGLSVVGMVHSHTYADDDEPSVSDRRFSARYPDVLLATAVFHPWTGSLIWYDKDGETGRERLELSWLRKLVTLFRW